MTLCFVQLLNQFSSDDWIADRKKRWHSTVVFLNSKRIRGRLFGLHKCAHGKATHICVILTLVPEVKTSVVAAATIFSCLLRAGDVEVNPGPGKKKKKFMN